MSTRIDGRSLSDPRPISIELGLQQNPEGSVLYRCGGTLVMISASVSEGAPDWMRDGGAGWVTAEYVMHPCANPRRQRREGGSKVSGRSKEITRLIGRALRAAVNLERLGERTITVDCDVIQADGGTRTAAITGGCVALVDALRYLQREKKIKGDPFKQLVSAISVGIYKGVPVLDLDYPEDSKADTDLNVVMTENAELIEVQGTAEAGAFNRQELNAMLDLAEKAGEELREKQREALGIRG